MVPAWLTAGTDFARTTEFTFRIIPVVFGVALLALLPLIRDGLGRTATASAGVLTALSPAMVYYSRFYIQEMLLVFFTFAAIAAGWRYVRTRCPGWAAAAGASLAFMHATKETCVIAAAAIVLALGVCALLYGDARREVLSDARWWHLGAAAGAGFLVWGTFYSSFFTHPVGLLDSVRTYIYYLAEAGGGGAHVHPWYFYLKRLAWFHEPMGPVWSEAFILVLAAAGVWASFSRRSGVAGPFPRFLAVYSLLLVAMYSIIPYKTPWSFLSALQGLVLLAGLGGAAAWKMAGGRWWARAVVGLVLLAGAAHLGWQAHRATIRRFRASPKNPYAYAQTQNTFLNLVERIEQLARVHPKGRQMLIKVVAAPQNAWPLPWYLRNFPNVGYWVNPGAVPRKPRAPVIVSDMDRWKQTRAHLGGEPQMQYYGLRPGELSILLVRKPLWKKFMDTRR
jgi:uncharacterized protein (TIGR03663 family)